MSAKTHPSAKLPRKSTLAKAPSEQSVRQASLIEELAPPPRRTALSDDAFFTRLDWTDLAVLHGRDTPLGRAVRRAQLHFPDEEISNAMHGHSKTVTLAVIGTEPMFLNAAMVADVLVHEFELGTVQG